MVTSPLIALYGTISPLALLFPELAFRAAAVARLDAVLTVPAADFLVAAAAAETTADADAAVDDLVG